MTLTHTVVFNMFDSKRTGLADAKLMKSLLGTTLLDECCSGGFDISIADYSR